MVTAEESQKCQQLSALNSRNLNLMALLQLEQNCSLPYFVPSPLTANLALPRLPISHLLGLNTGQSNAVAGNISYPCRNPCLKNFQHGIGDSDKPVDASCVHGKRFLIFDRSGNHTRLFVSPSFSLQNNTRGSCEKATAGVDQQFLVRPVAKEKWDENSFSDMIEDTEDINALLYSDSDYEYDDDDDINDGKNYEGTSMRHTLLGIDDCGNKDILLEQPMEEVASSDSSPKRQKLLDGSYKKSSLVGVECDMKRAPPSNHKNGLESHDIDGNKTERILKTVKVLGSLIPGINSKDPLSIIEKAIVYLEKIKMEAIAAGYATLD